MGRKSYPMVFGLKLLPAASFIHGVLGEASTPRIVGIRGVLSGICHPFFLEIDGPAPGPAAFQSTCSMAPLSPVWEEVRMDSCMLHGGRAQETAAHMGKGLLTRTETGSDDAGDGVRVCPHEVTDGSVTNCM